MAMVEARRDAAVQDPKIAVVVIHGMGEQKPMQTLRSFVVAAWQRNRDLFRGVDSKVDHDPWDVWTKPDTMSGSSELRRITTARARHPADAKLRGQRADFFELHWADLTTDTTWGDFLQWFVTLLWRLKVPSRMRLVWMLLWVLVIALGLSAAATAWAAFVENRGSDPLAGSLPGTLLAWDGWAVVTALLAVFGWVVKGFLTTSFGDVARYVSAAPRNIRVRQEARQRGLKLLDELAASGEYGRIIVAGHSLGSILAHDLVLLAWAQAAQKILTPTDSALHKALRACEKASDELLGAAGYQFEEVTLRPEDRSKVSDFSRQPRPAEIPGKLAAYRQSQRELFKVLAATPLTIGDTQRRSAWLISDLVTLGSPLTHAEFLLADSLEGLRNSILMRETLRCPPVLEPTGTRDRPGPPSFIHEYPKGSGRWRTHHGAAMAPVRWTNIHDASTPFWFMLGDLISGPIARDFGPGVADVKVTIRRQRGLFGTFLLRRVFTHTLYWKDFMKGFAMNETPPDHVLALQQALNLLDDPATETALLARSCTG